MFKKTQRARLKHCVYMTLGSTSFLSVDFWDLRQDSDMKIPYLATSQVLGFTLLIAVRGPSAAIH